MNYIEMTTDEAIEVLRKSKGKKVLVAIKNLENEDDAIFVPQLKSECEAMIQEAESIFSMCDDFVKSLNLFTEKQKDYMNINPCGLKKIILLRE